MERTYVSMNVPNIISVNLMFWGVFLLLVLAYHLIRGRGLKTSRTGTDSNSPAAY